MYKGYKVTKHLKRYMGYVKNKYEKCSLKGKVDLWEIMNEYEYIMEQPKCVQMFLYDMVCDKFVHYGKYSIVRSVDGGVYIKELANKL